MWYMAKKDKKNKKEKGQKEQKKANSVNGTIKENIEEKVKPDIVKNVAEKEDKEKAHKFNIVKSTGKWIYYVASFIALVFSLWTIVDGQIKKNEEKQQALAKQRAYDSLLNLKNALDTHDLFLTDKSQLPHMKADIDKFEGHDEFQDTYNYYNGVYIYLSPYYIEKYTLEDFLNKISPQSEYYNKAIFLKICALIDYYKDKKISEEYFSDRLTHIVDNLDKEKFGPDYYILKYYSMAYSRNETISDYVNEYNYFLSSYKLSYHNGMAASTIPSIDAVNDMNKEALLRTPNINVITYLYLTKILSIDSRPKMHQSQQFYSSYLDEFNDGKFYKNFLHAAIYTCNFLIFEDFNEEAVNKNISRLKLKYKK